MKKTKNKIDDNAGTAPRGPKRVYGGQDHVARVTERRQRFIEAGIQQFGTVGYHATTVRSLCAQSGLTSRYFYESFESIEALLIATYLHLMNQFKEQTREKLAKVPRKVDALAQTGIRCYFEAVRDPLFARIVLLEVMGVSPAVDAASIKNTRASGQFLMDYFQSANPQTNLSKAELEVVGFSLAGATTFAAIQWMISGYKMPIDSVMKSTMAIVLGTAMALKKT